MTQEIYTPGHDPLAVAFMERRTLASHGQFFVEHLKPGDRVLDCACGPGSITLGIAEAVKPGPVTGVDFGASQIERARQAALERGVSNVTFVEASCYELPFESNGFDRIFSHALLEHLSDPGKAVAEFHRVLAPGGVIGLCTPDLGSGVLVSPPSREMQQAIAAYVDLQRSNGGDLAAGTKLGSYLRAAGFQVTSVSARFDSPPPHIYGAYLAHQLDNGGRPGPAATFREWSRQPDAFVGVPWVAAIGRK
ncbi:MAG TPA: methyltransferase domain-containing protein [Polyangiaceae bacterium]|nr:methyltransferase domain-containing protein [Polyangiaceae bacterium]